MLAAANLLWDAEKARKCPAPLMFLACPLPRCALRSCWTWFLPYMRQRAGFPVREVEWLPSPSKLAYSLAKLELSQGPPERTIRATSAERMGERKWKIRRPCLR